ncbi:membrane-bound lytic murein transglycosylase D [Cupriavidus necator N-1]|jgi:membrane-bound lytic murein transglycosylase D|uniref:Membrane-bound lytic murein transglycosylase D n=1 Tax=Cupriavidus necator (strain ATCC 43291 / DSM 13513 / CCUG 52238 / LMG 8453 / N-1) TaxID=1042878 RepID=G0F166_CUPNN|nr:MULTISPECIES: transglycosylase SLT domain-containing protein [Cupriavidus]AEI77697.1 membrane-bound lytic murein transglycosylase D [Cupriavidus necator N-1]KAI3606210.1 Membrane-bound lytic murein transglycosylase D [Cupriavidus necator H850]MDX6013768.1 transglycosylase SLT domain-containing protein [Cupriavidus necator]QUN27165.1 transglycosylase SLT domain-containing protein [Cupriavidus sp. KK10]
MKIGRLLAVVACAALLAACASTPTPPDGAYGAATAQTAKRQDPLNSLSDKSALSSASTINVDQGGLDWLRGPSNDIWDRIRRGFAMQDLEGTLVDDRTQWYAQRPEYMERMVGRSSRYLYHIVEELERRKMPTELALLPFVESAFNPQAQSTAKAAGMWQFIPSTGRSYNLKQNMFRDERRDVLASTDAALDYLARLYDMFGDWHLALAAYNWGEGAVSRAIARNQARGLPTDYASLPMPNETRYYVPKLQAVKNIIANPAAYNVKLPEIPDHPYFVTVTTSRDIDVNLAAKLADMSVEEFKALNPSFNRPVILGASNPQILLPFDNAERFQYNLNTYRGGLSSWSAVTVDSRERIEALAARLNVDADTLREINSIPKGMRLKAGSTVMIPRSGRHDQDISATLADSAMLAMEPDLPDARRVVVRASRRDTVASVARRYGVSAGQVQSWNKLSGTKLVAGQSLVLMVPVRGAGAVRAARAEQADRAERAEHSERAERSSKGGIVRTSAKGKAEPRKRITVEASSRHTAAKAAPARAARESKPGPTVKASAKAGTKGAKAR